MTSNEGIIEIEQTKSDRALNTTIFIASAGLATSGVASSIISTQVIPPANLFSPNTAFWWSLVIGLVPILIAFLISKIPRLFRRRS